MHYNVYLYKLENLKKDQPILYFISKNICIWVTKPKYILTKNTDIKIIFIWMIHNINIINAINLIFFLLKTHFVYI